jgi:hypothetical protein
MTIAPGHPVILAQATLKRESKGTESLQWGAQAPSMTPALNKAPPRLGGRQSPRRRRIAVRIWLLAGFSDYVGLVHLTADAIRPPRRAG